MTWLVGDRRGAALWDTGEQEPRLVKKLCQQDHLGPSQEGDVMSPGD